MTDKTIIMRTFNSQFSDFLNDLLSIFSTNQDIKNSYNTFQMIKRVNPSIIIKVWYSNIYLPYNKMIDEDDIAFFLTRTIQVMYRNLANQKI